MYKKETFRGIYTPVLFRFNISLVYHTPFHWCFCLILDCLKFHMKLENLKKIVSKFERRNSELFSLI